MGFMGAYKCLEKLCGDVLQDDRRISAYIDAMLALPQGSYLVEGWDEDLKQLKHYRWMRNQITHEPDCSEENMCREEDELWVAQFYTRIMHQTDPLAMYRKQMKRLVEAKTQMRKSKVASAQKPAVKQKTRDLTPLAVLLVFTILVVLLVLIGVAAWLVLQ